MFDYNKAEAVTLGFEPLGAQMSKPEISVVNLSDYTQVTSKAASASIPTTSSTATFMTAALSTSSRKDINGSVALFLHNAKVLALLKVKCKIY